MGFLNVLGKFPHSRRGTTVPPLGAALITKNYLLRNHKSVFEYLYFLFTLIVGNINAMKLRQLFEKKGAEVAIYKNLQWKKECPRPSQSVREGIVM